MSVIWSQISALLWKQSIQTKRSQKWAIIKSIFSILFSLYPMTYLCLSFSIGARDVSESLFLFVTISIPFLLMMDGIVSQIMLEKTSKIREHFRIQGLGEIPYALSYTLDYSTTAVIWSTFLTLYFALLSSSSVFTLGLAFNVVIFYCLCLISAVPIAYIHCAFFDNPKVARLFVNVTWTAPALPLLLYYYFKANDLFPSVDVAGLCGRIAQYLQYCHPAASLAYNLSPLNRGSTSQEVPFELFLGPLFQIPIYLVLGIYLHQVIKSKYGSSRPWNFFLVDAVRAAPSRISTTTVDPSRFEPTNTERPAGVVIENVVKEFDNGSVVAVNNLSLSVYKGEIFALLGHNGAGKTTLLECLVGTQSVTHGRILLDGVDIADSLVEARQSVGVCPQFDAFYRNFKPLEILELYGRLRGQSAAEAHSNAEMMLERMGLVKKMHSMAEELSGGQRRKLSVGLAFSGNSKTVILDEPSCGLDLESALELWSAIRNLRSGRTIIMTTHNMNEAEALGDRIGIMSAGTMQCLGSSVFLKSRLGSGYHLSFNVMDGSQDGPAQISSLVVGRIPNAQLLPSQSGRDLSFQISNDDVHLMTGLLLEIEAQKSSFNVQDYTLVPSRLEDVFLSITKSHEEQLGNGLEIQKPLPDYSPGPVPLSTHFLSVLILVYHYFRTDVGYLLSTIVPILLAIYSWWSESSFFVLSFNLLVYITATTACSNISHFARSDIRLQLDIFGLKFYVYWITIIVWNLIQSGLPFGFVMVCLTLSELHVDFLSPGIVSAFVFDVVGFMAFIRSTRNPVGGFKALVIPLCGFVLISAIGESVPPFVSYVAELLKFSPVVLLYFRSFRGSPVPDSTVIVLLMTMGAVYFALAILLDYHRLHPNRIASASSAITGLETGRVSDEDVLAESNRLKSGANDVVQVVNLAKAYNKTVAVRGITVGVPGGQSLAFLGINGSGKSSSIRCMLGISAPSRGHVKIAGINVNEDEFGARQRIGYVPQHDDILIGRMTARQQLTYVARLSGVPGDVRSELVNRMLFNVGLDKAADRRSETYSGGMKRKLCVAMALMIKRDAVLLDEPSSGVDPASRRRFWSMFAQIQSDPGRCLLLTTHQLDEAEAVCDRISIMVGGEIFCIGSAAHLKRKFGNHYQVDLTVAELEQGGVVRNWFTTRFPRAVLVEADGSHLRFWVPKSQVESLAALFAFVQDRDQLSIRDSVVGEATLEQIFLSIAYKSKSDPNAHFVQVYNP